MRDQLRFGYRQAQAGGGVVLLSSLLLAGCLGGAGNPDGGDSQAVQVSGLGVDGYLAGARVYADLNGNNKQDPFEPQAFTDSFGFFSYRPELRSNGVLIAAERDYCAEGVTRYCLRIPPTQAEALIRVQGGFDLFSGEAFVGSVSRRIAISNSDSTMVLAVSPYTSLQPGVVVGTLDVWGDYFDGADYEDSDAVVAVEIHQLLVRLSERLLGAVNSDAAQNEFTGFLYASIRELLAAGATIPEAWYALTQVEIETAIVGALADIGVVNAAVAENLATFAIELRDTIETYKTEAGGEDLPGLSILTDLDERARIESRIQAILAYMGTKPSTIGSDDAQLIQALTDALIALGVSAESIDLARLVEIMKAALVPDSGGLGAIAADDVTVGGVYPELAQTFIRASFVDDSASGSITLYFEGEPIDALPGEELAPESDGRYASEGKLTLCMAGQLGSLDFSDFTDEDSASILITGDWQRPNDRTLILTLSAFGGSFQETASLRLRNGTNDTTWVFSLDYDGDLESFEADRPANDFTPIGDRTIPVSQETCEALAS